MTTPHGGGEGKSPVAVLVLSHLGGKPALGYKTRKEEEPAAISLS